MKKEKKTSKIKKIFGMIFKESDCCGKMEIEEINNEEECSCNCKKSDKESKSKEKDN